ncbi:hypothetical protein UFOVP1470_9 [uncultured Caudovirales phage]|uniref:Uncharacterized protein n=1 Tax=uncultured Caudovirales phage TaxID=2100421 RepID=A0A6J7XJG3_9CAUD|nr:hypothetical protein UFOVP939_17 [uncultured Caudovirales phage]CAB4178551.1 hypothetical protein UFOVP1018_7 [uncultured Caudovirales phage]CAB4183812.1 hypothetical protein UFOVP1105_8 [uncultured Caudovirales phage]CAB4202959.1 hypothetical protein UFOVP1372_52 [uncultured Caudovirales phage]CAB4214967.1 hypothetical protein UFOVP1470_9 [uncultured Caudovirales phage]
MFYKYEDGNFEEAAHIDGTGYSLTESGKDEYTYPIAGWYWYDSEEVAKAAMGYVEKAKLTEGL